MSSESSELSDALHDLRAARASLAIADSERTATEERAHKLESLLVSSLQHLSHVQRTLEKDIAERRAKRKTTWDGRVELKAGDARAIALRNSNLEWLRSLQIGLGETRGVVSANSNNNNNTTSSTTNNPNNNAITGVSDGNNHASAGGTSASDSGALTDDNPIGGGGDAAEYDDDDEDYLTDLDDPLSSITQGGGSGRGSEVAQGGQNNSSSIGGGTGNALEVSEDNTATTTSTTLPSTIPATAADQPALFTSKNVLKALKAASSMRLHPLMQPDIMSRVFTYLQPMEAASCMSVCRSWRSIPLRSDCGVWRLLARNGMMPPSIRGGLWKALAFSSSSILPGREIALDRDILASIVGWMGPDVQVTNIPNNINGVGSGGIIHSLLPSPRRPLKMRTIHKLFSQREGGGGGSGGGGLSLANFPLTLETGRMRNKIDHSLRFATYPKPVILQLGSTPSSSSVAAPPPPPPSSGSSFDQEQGTMDPFPNEELRVITIVKQSADIFNLYLKAGLENEAAADLLRECKDIAASVRGLRSEVKRLENNIHDAAMNNIAITPEQSELFASRHEAAQQALLTARSLEAHAREQVLAAHSALENADKALVSSLLEARRRFLHSTVRSWAAQQRRGVPQGASQPLLVHNYTHPATGSVTPTQGVKLPLAPTRSVPVQAVSSSSAQATSTSTSSSSSASVSGVAPSGSYGGYSSTPVLSSSSGIAGQSIPSFVSLPTSAMPLSTTVSTSGGSNTSYSSNSTGGGGGASLQQYTFDLNPFFPLPERLKKLLNQKAVEDFDDAEETALGLSSSSSSSSAQQGGNSSVSQNSQLAIVYELTSSSISSSSANNSSSNSMSMLAMSSTTSTNSETAAAQGSDHGASAVPMNTHERSNSTVSEPPSWPEASLNQTLSNDALILPPLPFPSQHKLIDDDVKRTFGDIDSALSAAVAASTTDEEASVDASQLFPTAVVSSTSSTTSAGINVQKFSRSSLVHLRKKLRNNLLAYAAFDHLETGYCQGMNFLSAMLLRHSDEVAAFWGLASLINAPQFAMRDMFSAGLYKVGLSFHTLSVLLKRHNPKLGSRLIANGVSPNMYCAGWVMTIFSSLETLPVAHAAALWDTFLLSGWKAVWRCILTLMDGISDELLLDMSSAVQVLHQYPRLRLPPSPASLMRRVHRINVTATQLRAISLRYDRKTFPQRYVALRLAAAEQLRAATAAAAMASNSDLHLLNEAGNNQNTDEDDQGGGGGGGASGKDGKSASLSNTMISGQPAASKKNFGSSGGGLAASSIGGGGGGGGGAGFMDWLGKKLGASIVAVDDSSSNSNADGLPAAVVREARSGSTINSSSVFEDEFTNNNNNNTVVTSTSVTMNSMNTAAGGGGGDGSVRGFSQQSSSSRRESFAGSSIGQGGGVGARSRLSSTVSIHEQQQQPASSSLSDFVNGNSPSAPPISSSSGAAFDAVELSDLAVPGGSAATSISTKSSLSMSAVTLTFRNVLEDAATALSVSSFSSIPATLSMSAPHSPTTGLSPEDLSTGNGGGGGGGFDSLLSSSSSSAGAGGIPDKTKNKPTLSTPDTWGAFSSQRDDAFDQVNHFSPNGLASPFPTNNRLVMRGEGGGGDGLTGDNVITQNRVRGLSLALDVSGTGEGIVKPGGGTTTEGLVRKLTLPGSDLHAFLQNDKDSATSSDSTTTAAAATTETPSTSAFDEIAWPEPELGGKEVKATLPSLKEGAEALKEGITNIFSKIKL